ncbi:RNA polymerase sigma factor [Microvirga calopogonii]|uniref:RNA polymerase sigma factor n=1 Tax=Microvirga calopogonii TaxID=2078013 RepID=UPI000E0CE80C|nr:RNA polymerase sigma factor [Microvirga calopogonii]
MQKTPTTLPDLTSLDDMALVSHARAGNSDAFRIIMQRHNRRLYRVARGVIGNDIEAEDVVQESYLKAFTHLDTFRGEAQLSTWLTRIVLNEALGRVRRRREILDLSTLDRIGDGQAQILVFQQPSPSQDPEAEAGRAQLRRMVEQALDDLPEAFRSVFVMREIEEMNTEETASHLGIRPETVKTRLHRARRLLQKALHAQFVATLKDAFPFDGLRCKRVTDRVMQRLELKP